MNHIKIKNFHINEVKFGETDLILSTKKDITDFVAIGFYCLYKTITTPDETEIRVGYQDAVEKNKIANSSLFCICTEINAVCNYVYGKKQDVLIAIYIAIAMSLHTTGVKLSDKLSEILPEQFNISDCMAAQQLAIDIVRNRVYTL